MTKVKAKIHPVDVSWGQEGGCVVLRIRGLTGSEANALGERLKQPLYEMITEVTGAIGAHIAETDDAAGENTTVSSKVICMCPHCVAERARGRDARTDPNSLH